MTECACLLSSYTFPPTAPTLCHASDLHSLTTLRRPAAPADCNAPLCTIDPKALSSTRYLIPDRKLLAFRDEAGRINLHMVLECARQVRTAQVTPDAAQREKLEKWERHVVRWEKATALTWEREATSDGTGCWVSSMGARRAEVRVATGSELALMRQRTESLARKKASRVDESTKAARRQALDALVNQRVCPEMNPICNRYIYVYMHSICICYMFNPPGTLGAVGAVCVAQMVQKAGDSKVWVAN